IELAIDMIEMAPVLDHIVLFSGDGDFRRLVEAVQRKGLRVSVVSTVRSQPPMVADELRRQADNFIELQDLQAKIAREPQWREGEEHERQAPSAAQIHENFAGDEDGEFHGETFDDEDGEELVDAR
ncbi:MAG: NYN domain-containing protein, partial [Alphaproteobacteria bacterium]|nr:NYN domain-containing protein [Alphaproteobacteria bacterium]